MTEPVERPHVNQDEGPPQDARGGKRRWLSSSYARQGFPRTNKTP